MNIEKNINGKIIILRISGELIQKEKELQQCLSSLSVDKGGVVVLNLAGVNYINSILLGVIAKFCSELHRSGGDLCITNASSFVANLLEITHLNQVITLFDNEDDAVAHFESA
ncbi:MAG: STAS domain-containing protein [Candidatus Wallbacteria bacterium]|nr:STAS domain-containing protein [Candidatus Wallbacteria bacterium]